MCFITFVTLAVAAILTLSSFNSHRERPLRLIRMSRVRVSIARGLIINLKDYIMKKLFSRLFGRKKEQSSKTVGNTAYYYAGLVIGYCRKFDSSACIQVGMSDPGEVLKEYEDVISPAIYAALEVCVN